MKKIDFSIIGKAIPKKDLLPLLKSLKKDYQHNPNKFNKLFLCINISDTFSLMRGFDIGFGREYKEHSLIFQGVAGQFSEWQDWDYFEDTPFSHLKLTPPPSLCWFPSEEREKRIQVLHLLIQELSTQLK